MAKYFLLLTGLLLILGTAVAYGVSKSPPGKGKPRPNRKRRNKLIRSFLPTAAALFISVMAWVGLSLLFSTDQTDQAASSKSVTKPAPVLVQNSVTHKVEADRRDESPAAFRETPVEGPTELGPSSEPTVGFPSPLTQLPDSMPESESKKSSPLKPALSQAAQWTSPQDSPMEGLGLGQNLVKTEGESVAEDLPVPTGQPHAVPPRTVAHPRREPGITDIFPELKPQPDTPPASPYSGSDRDFNYTVLLASFSMKSNAERNLARLRAAGVPVFISMAEVNQRSYYRLMAGRFPTRDEAVQYGRKLERSGLTRETGRHMIKSLYDDTRF